MGVLRIRPPPPIEIVKIFTHSRSDRKVVFVRILLCRIYYVHSRPLFGILVNNCVVIAALEILRILPEMIFFVYAPDRTRG